MAKKQSVFKLRSGNSPLFKNIGSSPMTKLTDPTDPTTDGNTYAGEYDAEKAKTKSKKPTLGEWFRSTKLGKDLAAVGKDLQSKSKKVKTFTEGVTSKVASDVSKVKSKVETGAQKLTSKVASDFSKLAKTDVPKKFASDVKTKISKVKSKYADYKANRSKGESQWAYNKRKKKEAASNE